MKLDIGFLVLTECRAPQNHSVLFISSIPLHLQPNLSCPISFIPFHLKNDFCSYWTVSKPCCCLKSPQAPASNPALIALTESQSESLPCSSSACTDRGRKCLPGHLLDEVFSSSWMKFSSLSLHCLTFVGPQVSEWNTNHWSYGIWNTQGRAGTVQKSLILGLSRW